MNCIYRFLDRYSCLIYNEWKVDWISIKILIEISYLVSLIMRKTKGFCTYRLYFSAAFNISSDISSFTFHSNLFVKSFSRIERSSITLTAHVSSCASSVTCFTSLFELKKNTNNLESSKLHNMYYHKNNLKMILTFHSTLPIFQFQIISFVLY